MHAFIKVAPSSIIILSPLVIEGEARVKDVPWCFQTAAIWAVRAIAIWLPRFPGIVVQVMARASSCDNEALKDRSLPGPRSAGYFTSALMNRSSAQPALGLISSVVISYSTS